jgi:hypothetical protein
LKAALLASLDWWAWAGVCLAIGASLKGQLLLAAPVLLVWPIARGRIGNAFKLLAGFAAATMLIALPWMQVGVAGWVWLITACIGIGCMVPLVWRIRLREGWVLGLSLAGVVLAWPWRTAGPGLLVRVAPMVVIGMFAAARWLPARLKLPAVAMVLALLIYLLMPIFDASSQWYWLGFQYGTEKFDFMLTGNGAFNIARLLRVYYHWPMHPTDPVTIPWTGITLGCTQFSRIVSAILVTLCGIGAAIHDRRRERRFLVSMAAPWLLFFMVLTQMHGRYCIWAAGLSALLAGIDLGMAMLGVVVSIIGMLGMIENQLLFSRDWWPGLLDFTQQVDPGLGWVLLVASGVYLYCAIAPQPRAWISK